MGRTPMSLRMHDEVTKQAAVICKATAAAGEVAEGAHYNA